MKTIWKGNHAGYHGQDLKKVTPSQSIFRYVHNVVYSGKIIYIKIIIFFEAVCSNCGVFFFFAHAESGSLRAQIDKFRKSEIGCYFKMVRDHGLRSSCAISLPDLGSKVLEETCFFIKLCLFPL